MRKTVYLLLALGALAQSALAECIEFRRFRIEHGEKLAPADYLKKNYKQLQNALELGYLGTDTAVITPIQKDKIDFTNTVPFKHPAAYDDKLQASKLAKRHLGTAVTAYITRKDKEFHFDGMYYHASRMHDTVIATKDEHLALIPKIKELKIRLDLTLNPDKPEWIITPMPNTPAHPATYLALKYHKATPTPEASKAPPAQKKDLPAKAEKKVKTPKQPAPESKEAAKSKPESKK
ncbi:hypothetical protein Rhal01_02172 [Rubritalea halochordaticola]|uniref:Uncharacterized protein n=1 Tax=Rubritalea halochordaticola TaxID=714537 RepID=A0ABP9UZX3_9BACT